MHLSALIFHLIPDSRLNILIKHFLLNLCTNQYLLYVPPPMITQNYFLIQLFCTFHRCFPYPLKTMFHYLHNKLMHRKCLTIKHLNVQIVQHPLMFLAIFCFLFPVTGVTAKQQQMIQCQRPTLGKLVHLHHP